MSLVGLVWALPKPRFAVPYAIVLTEGNIPTAIAPAADGQIRFVPKGEVPARLAACVVAYEDQRFYRHIGIDPAALLRAARANLGAGRVLQGGSTLTMQVARLAGRPGRRYLGRKLLEMLQALYLEATLSKAEILALWAGHAPFGGNTVGLEAAAWRYFGQPPAQLTWAECATLAVLPNAPGMLHPGRSRNRLLARRNAVLQRLARHGTLPGPALAAALAEPLPPGMGQLPNRHPHLLAAAVAGQPQGAQRALTIRGTVQQRAEQTLLQNMPALQAQGIGNVACLVAEVATGRVVAYVGNLPQAPAGFVDAAQAPRSFGSLLKPWLYAHALDAGLLAPQAWLEDVPRLYGRFAPQNYYNEYAGFVPADKALARSLNLPFVGLLQAYGQRRFFKQMQAAGLRHPGQPADHYGLAFILGSAEASLWEMARLYTLSSQRIQGLPLRFGVWADSVQTQDGHGLPTAGALFAAWQALREATRPELEPYCQQLAQQLPVAWKTGTSQGLRDAWAVGCTPTYTVAVWAGNADGAGRPGLTGIKVAAPILFELMAQLPQPNAFFVRPQGGKDLSTCRLTGHPAGSACPESDLTWAPAGVQRMAQCSFHVQRWTDGQGRRIEAGCYAMGEAQATFELALPPLPAYYAYRAQALPAPLPWRPGCRPQAAAQLTLLTPTPGSRYLLPPPVAPARLPQLVLAATTSQPTLPLYWHLDGRCLGTTVGQTRQQLAVRLSYGPHRLVVVSADGRAQEATFVIQ